MVKKFEAIIIGAGQSGNPLAHNLADRGWEVAIIEKAHLGGSCINYGCTPTKAMIASSRVAQTVREASRYGIHTSEPRVNLKEVVARKNEIVQSWRQGLQSKIDSRPSLTLFRGEAHFNDAHTVEVDGEQLTADHIFINTGARSRLPELEGLLQVPYLTNKTILELTEVPEHLIILGGSYLGLEFGQMFRRFGSQVTVVEHRSRILPYEDEDVSQELQRILEQEGMKFSLNHEAARVSMEQGQIKLELRDRAAEAVTTLVGDQFLIGVGRTPNSEALYLEQAGVEIDRHGYIQTNQYLETNVPGIYAMGDVKGGPAFTHISYNDFQIIYHNLFNEPKKSIQDRLVPYTLYTDPELGRVGLTEKAARERGGALKVGKIPMDWVARAVEAGKTEGFMKIVIDADTDRLLGATILATEGGELVQSLMGLMLADAPWTVFKGAVFIHPTLTEGFFSLMDSVEAVQ